MPHLHSRLLQALLYSHLEHNYKETVFSHYFFPWKFFRNRLRQARLIRPILDLLHSDFRFSLRRKCVVLFLESEPDNVFPIRLLFCSGGFDYDLNCCFCSAAHYIRNINILNVRELKVLSNILHLWLFLYDFSAPRAGNELSQLRIAMGLNGVLHFFIFRVSAR